MCMIMSEGSRDDEWAGRFDKGGSVRILLLSGKIVFLQISDHGAYNIIYNMCTTAQKILLQTHIITRKHTQSNTHARYLCICVYARIIIGRPCRENLSYCVPKRKTVTINLSVSGAIILHIIRLGGAVRCVRDLNVPNGFRRPFRHHHSPSRRTTQLRHPHPALKGTTTAVAR